MKSSRPLPTPMGLGGSFRLTQNRETGVRWPAREGPEAASRRIEPGEKMQMSPRGLRLTRLEADMVISTFLFDPNLEPSP